jgi:L-cysteine desulfidase
MDIPLLGPTIKVNEAQARLILSNLIVNARDAMALRAKHFTEERPVSVNIVTDPKGLFIRTAVKTRTDEAECVIRGHHQNIVTLKLNGREMTDDPLLSGGESGGQKIDLQEVEDWLRKLSLKRLVRQRLIRSDMIVAARTLTSAGSDARMAGVPLPAMSSAGSGNHGLTATLPIWAVKDYLECDRKIVLEAVGLSHFLTAYVKAHTGRLSAVCGCSIAAGAGATAGITYLLGGDLHHMAGATMNLVEDLAGVICAGAKPGSSLKLATAAGTAVQAALFAIHGVRVQSSDGIIGFSPEQTMRNVGELSTQGMIETDRTILKIMLDKKFHHLRTAAAATWKEQPWIVGSVILKSFPEILPTLLP